MKKSNQIINQILSYTLMALMLLGANDVFSQKRKSYSTNINTNKGKSTIHMTENGNDFKIEYEGEITLSDDDSDIVGISNGGFIEIKKSSFGSKRRIVIESDRNGNLEKQYFVGRKEVDFNPEGKKWLAEVLLEVVRSTTIAAESRVQRFYSKGGAQAVLNEIENIESDYVMSRYFELLLEHDLNTSDLVRVIKIAGDEISSDHYLSGILESNQKAFLANDQTIEAYINATKSISSDHYTAKVLKKVVNDRSISDSQMASLLDISKNIQSDHYVSQVLTELVDNRELNDQNMSKIISISKDIQSDHYKTQLLKKIINDNDIPPGVYDVFISNLNDIQSDHYVSEVISELLSKKMNGSSDDLQGILDIVKHNISSDHYASNVYKKLANQNLPEDQLIMALRATTSINSDHYAAETLKAFSSQVRNASERVKSEYRTAAKSISSDTYYGRAVKAID